MEKFSDAIERFLDGIEKDFSISKSKILLATSICPDELNNDQESFRNRSSLFHLGGLGGYPHTGITGMNAYLDHISDDGAAVIVYGPHIGKNSQSELGFTKRKFQERETPTCGALHCLMNDYLRDKEKNFVSHDSHNLQLDFLKQRLYNDASLFTNTDIKEFTYKLFDIIHNDLLAIIKKSNRKNYPFPLFLLGGVIINSSQGNYFDELKSMKDI